MGKRNGGRGLQHTHAPLGDYHSDECTHPQAVKKKKRKNIEEISRFILLKQMFFMKETNGSKASGVSLIV